MIKIEKIVNIKTNEESFVEREETAQEKQEREEIEAELAKKEIEISAKTEQRALLLERLGITEEEAKLLLS